MPVQITIIGLGQTGASLGLALAAHKDRVFVTGHDKEFSAERLAKQKGAVDATNHNLPAAVENADLIVLAIPIHQVRETFGFIAQDIKKDAVVVDFTPVKSEVVNWAKELLPAHCYYVGLAPAVGPKYINRMDSGLDSARADLFEKSAFLLSAPSGTPGAAMKLVSDLVSLIGATVVMTDPVESDGLMASAHLLPQLTSAALLSATVNQPGWKEVRKVAGRAYYSVTSAFSEADDAESLSMLTLQNRQNVVHSLDRLINSLVELRDDLENEDNESLKKRLISAQQGRKNWISERGAGDWSGLDDKPVEKLTFMQRLFGSKFGQSTRRDG
ncbi:MAG: prephenate dehydrogenase [Anaerolineales bacterium]|jgi:prephenate dehydrogenase|nr:prephenate dehydrogenase [Anaerolineales bacterium]